MKILLVANFDRKRGQRGWYSVDQKLMNGFMRLGHMVLPFSERDAARELALIPTKALGAAKMRARLIETATHFAPDLIVFGHADLLDDATFARLREAVSGAKLAQFNIDSTVRLKTMAGFTARAAVLDRSFITTGDREALSAISPRSGSVCFMPNPVDPSIETARVFDAPRDRVAYDGIFLGTGIEKRGEQLEHLGKNLPTDYRFHIGGRAKDGTQITSTAFLEALASAATSPNLPLDDTVPTPRLYSSDRIAQLLGQGVLAYTHAPAGLEALYGDGVVPWDSREALTEAMARMAQDDAERRRLAEIGWRLAHERTANTVVCDAMLDAVFERPASHDYAWDWEPRA